MRRYFRILTVFIIFAATSILGAAAQDTKVVKIDVIDQAATGADVELSGGTGVVTGHPGRPGRNPLDQQPGDRTSSTRL